MNIQKKSNLIFKQLALKKNISLTEKVGRYSHHKGIEKNIFFDIKKKLDLKKNDNFLDIGCGCGPLTDLTIDYCNKNKINVTLCDIPEVLKILRKKYKKFKNIKYFNKEFHKIKTQEKFDKILCYSVIHYNDSPLNFTKKIISFLDKEGKALIGDIPNINKKYRYLNSNFYDYYTKRNFENFIRFKSFSEFLKLTKKNKKINDDLIINILLYCKKINKTASILKQNKNLPFSFTRQDILIEEF